MSVFFKSIKSIFINSNGIFDKKFNYVKDEDIVEFYDNNIKNIDVYYSMDRDALNLKEDSKHVLLDLSKSFKQYKACH